MQKSSATKSLQEKETKKVLMMHESRIAPSQKKNPHLHPDKPKTQRNNLIGWQELTPEEKPAKEITIRGEIQKRRLEKSSYS